MKVKTADLIGPALDWAVASLECDSGWLARHLHLLPTMPFSTDWSQGGPLIEREKLEIRANDYGWQAYCFGFPASRAHKGRRVWAVGPTPLIAAMRCYCCAKLGEFIDIPEELCQQPNN